MRISDWSSDVCSSDLQDAVEHALLFGRRIGRVERVHRAASESLLPTPTTIWAGKTPLFPETYLPIEARAAAPASARRSAGTASSARRTDAPPAFSSDERRVGKECVSTRRSRCSPLH